MNRLHPLSLILLALWFSSAAIFVPQLAWLGAVLIISIIFRGLQAGFEWRLWARQFLLMLPLFLAILLIQALFVKDGELLWGRSWYAIHSGGLRIGLAFCLRLLILFFSAQILLKLEYEDFDLAFNTVRLPEELGFMVFYALHVIPASGERIRHALQILRLRGIDQAKQPLKTKLRLYKLISLSVLAEVLSRSAIQATALDLRGFRSSGPRSRLNQRGLTLPDYLLFGSMLVLTAIYIIF
ncbi:MAG: energy-coupling factor transporter transmembrane protein EcfT [Candidatus Syntrophosphaera sp.]|nr:energy-coupling factor transporter transmembrane protein EcfT [Candidatus Syntrophosphaera sp.]